MTWQEYQEAVALLYEQLEGIGTIQRNIRMPDRLTGQDRQIDVLLTLESKGHKFQAVVDAKFHGEPIDVKVIEEVVALADAVGVGKSVIVAANGWTAPAEAKAEHRYCDLRLFTLEDALDLIEPEKWMMCTSCQRDCIVLDQGTIIPIDVTADGLAVLWLGGACRECRHAIAWCQQCGIRYHLEPGESVICSCGYQWENDDGDVWLSNSEEMESR
jgi:Fe-S cluster biogenesis protein NfuA